MIEPQKVAVLQDEKGLDDPLEIGWRLKADKVVAVDIESFSVIDGPTLLCGRATARVHVYDVATKADEWNKQPPQFQYPSTGPRPIQEISEGEFRNNFITVMAERIARYFHRHNRYARDEDSLRQ